MSRAQTVVELVETRKRLAGAEAELLALSGQRDRLRDALARNIRIRHLLDHPNCRPGPVEQCPSKTYRDEWAALTEPLP